MNKELWKIYLEEVNYLPMDNKNNYRKKVITNLDSMLIFIISLAIAITSLWFIAQEIVLKLKF